jgi:hypothetical protein
MMHSRIVTLMLRTEMVPEMLVVFKEMTWLKAHEYFITVSHHESIKSM